MKLKGLAAIGPALVLAVSVLLTAGASASDIYYVPDAGGNWSTCSNWSLGRCPRANDDVRIEVSGSAHKAVYYDTNTSGFDSLKIDGDGAAYGALWHLDNSLMTDYMYIGDDGEAWEWMEGDAFLWVLENLYVGQYDPGPGHLYLNVQTYGVAVNGDAYVGYYGPGDFDHRDGYHMCSRLIVGQNAPGTYWLQGPQSTSTLSTEYWAIVGNGDMGLFEQTGGTFDITSDLMVGLNTGGDGTYLMKGGALNACGIWVGYYGDGYFTQSGGDVSIEDDLGIGRDGTHPHRAWYKVNDDDGDPYLYVGGDLLIGEHSLAKFEQTSGGTVEVDGNVEIWDGDDDPYANSYMYMGLNADWLAATSLTNHSGYYDQDGGILTVTNFTNDSDQGVNLDNSADCRARYFTHNAGPLYMWRNAILRGPYAGGGDYYLCNLTNNATMQMGNASFNGGTFAGHMTNNGSFNYTQGDFSASTLTNYGTVNLNAPFTCNRLVQNAYSFTVTPAAPITANGTGYASAFESNANLTIQSEASITVVDAPLVNNDNLYGGGEVNGNVENNDFLIPGVGTSATGQFNVNGSFTQTGSGTLRIRLGGTTPISEYDRVIVTGAATLAGDLEVRLSGGFTPSLGDSFTIMQYASRTGQFNPVHLPDLPDGLEWQLTYGATNLTLTVIESQTCPGDVDGDGDTDHSDLGALLAAWGSQPGDPNWNAGADLDGNGEVGHSDLGILLADWGCGM